MTADTWMSTVVANVCLAVARGQIAFTPLVGRMRGFPRKAMGTIQGTRALELGRAGLNPGFATNWQCHLGHITYPL